MQGRSLSLQGIPDPLLWPKLSPLPLGNKFRG